MSSILDPSALLSTLPNLVHNKRLESSLDGLVSLFHTAMVAVGFRLNGIDDSNSNSSSQHNILPPGWNANGPSHYTLRYKHEQSSLQFHIHVSKLGPRTLINAITDQTEKTLSLDISTNDFVSPSFYPHDLDSGQPLVNGFISSNRVSDLISQFKLKILQNLIPRLNKEGYVETGDDPAAAAPRPAAQPAPPTFPRFNPDEEFPLQQPSHLGPIFPGRNPLEIGRRDLDPFPNPFSPPSLFPDPDGGMLPGPNHPIFGGRNSRNPGLGPTGPWGGDGYLPPMGAPPGARFDPVGPMGPFPGPGRTLGRNRAPDPDIGLPPPGSSDMFM